jgi:hypothetical protein
MEESVVFPSAPTRALDGDIPGMTTPVAYPPPVPTPRRCRLPIGAFFYYTRSHGSMGSPTGTPEGTTFPPDLERLGLFPGAKIDIRDLDDLRKRFQFDVILYFEEDLARESTLREDLQEYSDVPDLERPFIKLDAFLQFATESDSLFVQRLDELPLIVEIIAYGESALGTEKPTPYVKGLMPFLDELSVEDFPVAS